MSGFLARVRTVLTAAPTYLTALAVIISIFSEEISTLLPEGPAGQVSHWAVVAVGWLGAAVTIIRRVTPVIPDERGLIAKGKHEQGGMGVRYGAGLGIVAALAFGITVAATTAPTENERLCALEAFHPEIPVYDECIPPTTEPSTTTSTTEASTTTFAPTTTTEPPATTTTVPFVADPMVLAQLAREPFKIDGSPKPAFDIILTNIGAPGPRDLWTAAYKTDLGTGYCWISGDRAGYQKAYMFLVDCEGDLYGRVVGRVSFWTVTDNQGVYFGKVNDRYMDEIQTTKLGYDGTTGNPPDQGQAPGYVPFTTFDDSLEDRPIILFRDDLGNVIEDRSYTNTSSPSTSVFRFGPDGPVIDWVAATGQPRIDNNGYGNAPHPIYYQQTVYARLLRPDLGNHFYRIIGVEYVSFLPDFPITNG